MAQAARNTLGLDWDFDPQPILTLPTILDSAAYLAATNNGAPQIIIGGNVDDPILFDLSRLGQKLDSIRLASSRSSDNQGGEDYPYTSHTTDAVKLGGSLYTNGVAVGAGQAHTYAYTSGDYHSASESAGTLGYLAQPYTPSAPEKGYGGRDATYVGPIKETQILDIRAGKKYDSDGKNGYGSDNGFALRIETTKFGFGDIADSYDKGVKDASSFAGGPGFYADQYTVSSVLAAGATGGIAGIMNYYLHPGGGDSGKG